MSAPLEEEIAVFLYEHMTQFGENLNRSKSLVQMYRAVAAASEGATSVNATDILRASVVFLHAALEELLRSVAVAVFPHAEAAVVNEIPLVGHNKHRKAEKFLLGDLLVHREKTVSQVISESIIAFHARQTYSNKGDILAFAKAVGISTTNKHLRAVLPQIEAMLRRRHQIVHRADRPAQEDQKWIRATSLSPRHVDAWITSTQRLVTIVMSGAVIQKYFAPQKSGRGRRKLTLPSSG